MVAKEPALAAVFSKTVVSDAVVSVDPVTESQAETAVMPAVLAESQKAEQPVGAEPELVEQPQAAHANAEPMPEAEALVPNRPSAETEEPTEESSEAVPSEETEPAEPTEVEAKAEPTEVEAKAEPTEVEAKAEPTEDDELELLSQ